MDVKRGVYETNNQPNKATFKYDGKITGKGCPVFDYTDKKIVAIDAYEK